MCPAYAEYALKSHENCMSEEEEEEAMLSMQLLRLHRKRGMHTEFGRKIWRETYKHKNNIKIHLEQALMV